MNCPSCQHENAPDSRFCEGCGASLSQTCATCGSESSPSAAFCRGCGAPLGQAAPAPDRDPRAYTPKHLADKILKSKSTQSIH